MLFAIPGYLARQLPLRHGRRIPDLACGKATSSIVLARELLPRSDALLRD